MDPDKQSKARKIIERLLKLPAAQRREEARKLCGDDAELRASVNSLWKQSVDAKSTAPSAPTTGAQVEPKIPGYEIIGRLGAGAMGVVWEAVQLGTRRRVALKLLSEASFGSERRRNRFVREVQLAASLEHPNIARVYESGLDKGVYYYAMELVRGAPLDDFVQAAKLNPKQILGLIRQICQGMQHAHERGVIHRDLKPSNILVDKSGKPRIVDFGLAKQMEGRDGLAMSMDGDVTGTPMYMSPEQAAGKVELIDARTDVYTLGVIAYRLLTGSSPHDLSGPYLDVLRRVAEEDVRPPKVVRANLDSEVEAILLKALSHDPAERYPTAGEFGEDIGRYLEGEPITARSASIAYVARKRLKKHRVAVLTTILVAALLVITAILARQRTGGEAPARQQEATVPPATPPFLTDADLARRKANLVQQLLATAQSDDSPAKGRDGLAALDEVLMLEPGNAQAVALHQKISAYYAQNNGSALPATMPTAVDLDARRKVLVAQLIQTARNNDSPATGRDALAALDEALMLDPGNSEATALHHKISAYFTPASPPSPLASQTTIPPQQITPPPPVPPAKPDDLTSGLVLFFSASSPPVNGVVKDESGNGNDGNIQGARWIKDADGHGAFSFDAEHGSDVIVVPNHPTLQVKQITQYAWIKTTRSDDWWQRIIDKNWRTGYDLNIGGVVHGKESYQGKAGNELFIALPTGKVTAVYTIKRVTNGTWRQIAGTYDGTNLKIYVDGVEKIDKTSHPGSIGVNNDDLRIGNGVTLMDDGITPEPLAFDGEIRNVRIYNRALSPDEIAALRNIDAAPPVAPLPSPLVFTANFIFPYYQTGNLAGQDHWVSQDAGCQNSATIVNDNSGNQLVIDGQKSCLIDNLYRCVFRRLLSCDPLQANTPLVSVNADLRLDVGVDPAQVPAKEADVIVEDAHQDGLAAIGFDDRGAAYSQDWSGTRWYSNGEVPSLHQWHHFRMDLEFRTRMTRFYDDGKYFGSLPFRTGAASNIGSVALYLHLRQPTNVQLLVKNLSIIASPASGAAEPPVVAAATNAPFTNSLGMKLVPIPAGTFMMGSPPDEQSRKSDEQLHRVTLSRPFFIAATPVTVAQFAAFVNDTEYKTTAELENTAQTGQIKSWRNPLFTNYTQDPNCPVVQVSWYDAHSFCDWLSRKEGHNYHLPTEAQWEYSCRAGTTTRFFTGEADQSAEAAAWLALNSNGHTHPVGLRQPNAWGLYDTIGNVWEWCADWYGPYPAGAVVDPTGPPSGSQRIRRGGSWTNRAFYCRSAHRYPLDPAQHSGNLGFRVALGG